MFKKQDRNEIRVIRHARVRKKISGTTERPRLCVYRSNSHIYAQVIDDSMGKTLAAAGSNEKDFGIYGGNIEAAKKVGQLVAERAMAAIPFAGRYRLIDFMLSTICSWIRALKSIFKAWKQSVISTYFSFCASKKRRIEARASIRPA